MERGLIVFSIGHSNHSEEAFQNLLLSAKITAIADVRSAPFSRHSPHFNQDELRYSLRNIGIAYSFLGAELGGRPNEKDFYCDGVADYEAMAERPEFKMGVQRVLRGAAEYKIALLCSEHNPLDCHRCLLVGRQLLREGADVEHILSNGALLNQQSVEEHLLSLVDGAHDDLFLPRGERLSIAYREQSRRVAFEEPGRIAASSS